MRLNAFVVAIALATVGVTAQQPVSRLKGRVLSDGQPIVGAEVHAEAFYGPAAGTFAGQRTFSEKTNRKGEWSIIGIGPGVWLFDVTAPGYIPEIVAMPVRLQTASGPNAGGMMFTWQLVLKPRVVPQGEGGRRLASAMDAAAHANVAEVRAQLGGIPADNADADYLAAAGRVAVLARDLDVARALFTRAVERDPSSYRAALGLATLFLLARDFDSASRAFDASRSRTTDKDEQRFLSSAIGDLATINGLPAGEAWTHKR
jgi:Tetratricopeptide repeat